MSFPGLPCPCSFLFVKVHTVVGKIFLPWSLIAGNHAIEHFLRISHQLVLRDRTVLRRVQAEMAIRAIRIAKRVITSLYPPEIAVSQQGMLFVRVLVINLKTS